MRRLFLVRHGETEGQSSIRLHGSGDVPLSDVGRQQVRRLIPRLAEQVFTAAVHSPLSRARESASILVDALRTPPDVVEVEPDLSEIDFGELEGMSLAELEAARPAFYRDWLNDSIDGYPGGDTIAGFRARVSASYAAILERHPRGDLLIVGHKGVVKQGLRALCGIDDAVVNDLAMDLGSLWVLRGDDNWSLELENVVG